MDGVRRLVAAAGAVLFAVLLRFVAGVLVMALARAVAGLFPCVSGGARRRTASSRAALGMAAGTGSKRAGKMDCSGILRQVRQLLSSPRVSGSRRGSGRRLSTPLERSRPPWSCMSISARGGRGIVLAVVCWRTWVFRDMLMW